MKHSLLTLMESKGTASVHEKGKSVGRESECQSQKITNARWREGGGAPRCVCVGGVNWYWTLVLRSLPIHMKNAWSDFFLLGVKSCSFSILHQGWQVFMWNQHCMQTTTDCRYKTTVNIQSRCFLLLHCQTTHSVLTEERWPVWSAPPLAWEDEAWWIHFLQVQSNSRWSPAHKHNLNTHAKFNQKFYFFCWHSMPIDQSLYFKIRI